MDPIRMTRNAGKVAEEVVSHLSGLVGSNVRITIEISADLPESVPDHVVRTVSENCKRPNNCVLPVTGGVVYFAAKQDPCPTGPDYARRCSTLSVDGSRAA